MPCFKLAQTIKEPSGCLSVLRRFLVTVWLLSASNYCFLQLKWNRKKKRQKQSLTEHRPLGTHKVELRQQQKNLYSRLANSLSKRRSFSKKLSTLILKYWTFLRKSPSFTSYVEHRTKHRRWGINKAVICQQIVRRMENYRLQEYPPFLTCSSRLVAA